MNDDNDYDNVRCNEKTGSGCHHIDKRHTTVHFRAVVQFTISIQSIQKHLTA